jgi:hypothetical protein
MTAPEDRSRRWLSFAGLGIALAPILVAVGRAIGSGWVPISDAGYFTVRSRDVFTDHHPLVGAWSSASASVGTTVLNLGPLQLDLLAPFTKIDPYWGTAVGVGVVAIASVIAVWWTAGRVFGPVGAAGAMLATLTLEVAIGSQPLIDPRQQIYLLMPFWAVLWLTWATALGLGAAIPPLVFAASLIAQTHFTFLLQTTALAIAALAFYGGTVRTRWRSAHATRWLLTGLVVAVGCWVQPLWDQLAGNRNLGAVLANRGAGGGVGWSLGARLVASTVLVPPDFWAPGTMGELSPATDLVSEPTAWLVLVVWLVLLVAAASVAWWRKNRPLAMLPMIGAIALTIGLAAGAAIPPTIFGYAPQNYFWMWPLCAFLTVGVLAGVFACWPASRRALHTSMGAIGLVVACGVVAAVGFRHVDHFASARSARSAGARVARLVLEELAAGLERHHVTGPVVIDESRSSFDNYVQYTLLAELQRIGIDFTFQPADPSVHRFGRERCADGRATAQIVVADAGGDPFPRPGEEVLAHVDRFSEDDAAELSALDHDFGEWLRDGTVTLSEAGFQFLHGRLPPGYPEVMSTPGRAASGLARHLEGADRFGLVEMPAQARDQVGRWVELQTRAALDDVTVLLAPATPVRGSGRRGVRAAACLD